MNVGIEISGNRELVTRMNGYDIRIDHSITFYFTTFNPFALALALALELSIFPCEFLRALNIVRVYNVWISLFN